MPDDPEHSFPLHQVDQARTDLAAIESYLIHHQLARQPARRDLSRHRSSYGQLGSSFSGDGSVALR